MRITTRTTRLGLAAVLAFGLAGVAPVHAQELGVNQDLGVFDTWDVDADGLVDQNEYRSTFHNAGWFEAWDDDDDDLLSDDEFDVGVSGWGMADQDHFDAWDVNDDEVLDENEFSVGVFDAWDEDGDSRLTSDEYDAGIGWFE